VFITPRLFRPPNCSVFSGFELEALGNINLRLFALKFKGVCFKRLSQVRRNGWDSEDMIHPLVAISLCPTVVELVQEEEGRTHSIFHRFWRIPSFKKGCPSWIAAQSAWIISERIVSLHNWPDNFTHRVELTTHVRSLWVKNCVKRVSRRSPLDLRQSRYDFSQNSAKALYKSCLEL